MRKIITVLLFLSLFSFKFPLSFFEQNINTNQSKKCHNLKIRYRQASKVPLKVAGGDLADIYAEAFVDQCFNKSPKCLNALQIMSHTTRELYTDFYPLHVSNNPKYHEWSQVEKLLFKKLYKEAEIASFKADKEFEKHCKK